MGDTLWDAFGYLAIGVLAAGAFLVGFGGVVMDWPFVEDAIGYAPLVMIGGALLVGSLVLLAKALDYLPVWAFNAFIGIWMVGWFAGSGAATLLVESDALAKACQLGGLLMALSIPVIRILPGVSSEVEPDAKPE